MSSEPSGNSAASMPTVTQIVDGVTDTFHELVNLREEYRKILRYLDHGYPDEEAKKEATEAKGPPDAPMAKAYWYQNETLKVISDLRDIRMRLEAHMGYKT